MKRFVSLGFLVMAACAHEERRSSAASDPEAIAKLEAKSGSTVTGQAELFVAGEQVTLKLEVENMSPGTHALHFHEKGDCSSSDGESAGDHWNPGNVAHGHLQHPPSHLGDMGNLEVGADGRGTLDFTTTVWTVGSGTDTDVVGKALVIHGGKDDLVSQPAGNSGPRIACGVVRAAKGAPVASATR